MHGAARSGCTWLVLASFVPVMATVACGAGPGGSQDLRVQASDGIKLAGTLHFPEGEPPFPAVILLHGSEPGQRTHAGYSRWARRFCERGIAALVFDKRGVGESEGEYVEGQDIDLLAGDAIAWLTRLVAHDKVDPERVGVLGWSQGGWVGPRVASRSPHCAFVVSISGPGVSPLEQNIYDKTNQFRAEGGTDEQAERFSKVVRAVWTYLATGEGHEEAQAAWDSVRGQSWFHDGYDHAPMGSRDLLLKHPRMKNFEVHMTYDPVPALERLRVSFLAVFGQQDTCTPVEASIKAMEAAFKSSGHRAYTIKVFPGADHGLRVRTCSGSAEPAPGYPDYVFDWVARTVQQGD